MKGREIHDYISLFQRTWKRGDNPSLIWGQMGLELGRACTGMLGWRRGPQDRVETRRNHPYFMWLVYTADFPRQAWNSKTIFWASCPYSYQVVKELRLIPSPVALQPAPLHPFRWQTKWSFQKAKLTQSSCHWKLCYFFPLVLNLEIYFFFLFTASKASCDLGFTGSLTAHCRLQGLSLAAMCSSTNPKLCLASFPELACHKSPIMVYRNPCPPWHRICFGFIFDSLWLLRFSVNLINLVWSCCSDHSTPFLNFGSLVISVKRSRSGTSLVVQGNPWAPDAGGPGSIPNEGTRVWMPRWRPGAAHK